MGSKQYNSSNNSSGGQHSKGTSDNSAGFKNVLLNVQLDALATLVDEQATRRLWKLFTNCAGSIAHGRRLENLSWRSWGRDRVVDWSGTRLKSDEYSDFDLRSKTPTKASNESYTRPSLPRFDSSTSTSTGLSSTYSSSSLPQPSTSFIVSRSPPLGPLIKRVIFTPPEPTDHAATALQLLMTSKRQLLSQRSENSTIHNEEGQRQSISQLSSPSQHTTFPTVVILESTPKPTPPDTPARGLSPTSDAQRSIFHHHQTLSPFHALVNPIQVVSDPEQPVPKPPTSLNPKATPAPRSTPMVVPISSSPAAGATVEKITTAPVPSAPGTRNCEHKPHSRTSSLLNPTTTTVPAESRQHTHSTAAANDKVGLGMAPTSSSNRMFFLQHDSSSLSLSPDSNSRSESHSRSPASRSPGTRITQAPSAGSGSDGGVYGKSNKVTGQDGSVVSRTEGDDPDTETKMEGVESKRDDNIAISRELLEESATRHNHHRPISPATAEHSNMSVPNTSSSSSSHTHPSRQQRLIMRSGKKGGYRSYLGRAHHERTSSKGSARASVGSRGSDSTSTTAGGGGRSGGAGSVDGNAGSTSASGMSTSAGSKLVMKRHPRTHSPLRNSMPVSNRAGAENVTAALLPPAHRAEHLPAASGSGQSGKKEPHVSPLAVLPEPLRMEVLERQVMQSAMKSQSNGRKISLESDSEEDDTDDVDETDNDEEIVVVKGTLKDTKSTAQRPVAEEEEGSSWSDEDDAEEVVVAKKRPQTQHEKHPEPTRTHSRRNSKDLDHLVGSAGSGRQPHGAHGRSKGKVANHHHHHPHHHVHVQRQQLSPPLRPAVARKGSSGHHTRSAPSQDGPLAQAAREALRQRDMFTPLPRETYSSTNLVREMSRTSLSRGGRPSNLTMLLNPDPQWFPQNHPYRRDVHPMDQKLSRSMEELYARGNGQRGNGNGVKSPRPGAGLGFGGLKMTTTTTTTPTAPQVTPRTQAPVPAPVTKPASSERPPPKRSSASSKSPPPPTKLRPSKSAVSIPAVTGVTASSTPRDEKQTDTLEMSLRQMGPVQRRQRVTRQPHEPALPEPERRTTSDQRDQHGNPSSRPSNRLGAKPADIEFSDTEDEEAPSSPPPKVAGTSGRSLAKEHLEAVMGGKATSAGMNASRTVVASPDVLPKESRESDPTSYRPPAPPSSPSVYNAHEAKRPQGHLPHTPPSSKRPPVARAPRIRPHSSHGQLMAEVLPPPSTAEAPQRDRRQPATSQPPVPVTTAPVHAIAPYPYNLPYPAPVQSPRTTRLNMLASEVPDDLRKDLLWERKTNRIAPILDNRVPTPLAPLRRNANATHLAGGGAEVNEESELARMEREAQERYDRMRTQTWNGVIYQRPVW